MAWVGDVSMQVRGCRQLTMATATPMMPTPSHMDGFRRSPRM